MPIQKISTILKAAISLRDELEQKTNHLLSIQ